MALNCNICKKDFEERKEFPGLLVCAACDAMGLAGVKKRGEIVVAPAVR